MTEFTMSCQYLLSTYFFVLCNTFKLSYFSPYNVHMLPSLLMICRITPLYCFCVCVCACARALGMYVTTDSLF
jgi:hypothetical protein